MRHSRRHFDWIKLLNYFIHITQSSYEIKCVHFVGFFSFHFFAQLSSKFCIFIQLNCLHQNNVFEGFKVSIFQYFITGIKKVFYVLANVSNTLSIFLALAYGRNILIDFTWTLSFFEVSRINRKKSDKEKRCDKLMNQFWKFTSFLNLWIS